MAFLFSRGVRLSSVRSALCREPTYLGRSSSEWTTFKPNRNARGSHSQQQQSQHSRSNWWWSPWSKEFPMQHMQKLAVQTILIFAVGYSFGSSVDLASSPVSVITNLLNPPEKAQAKNVRQAIELLKKEFDNISTDPGVLKSYGSSDNSYHPSSPHSCVVKPQSTEDVVKIVKIANKCEVPVVAYSGATSLEGHFSGISSGSICIDMSGMNKILAINEADSDLVCQPGARWEDINAMLKEEGIPLFFPLDPGPGATIGGMISTGCSGTNAVHYGTAKGEWFLNLTVVLPNGNVVKTRRRARKSSAGFDTTKLFVGAEGTLGIVTEATLRLAPRIPYKVAMAQFPDVEAAVSAVQEILKAPWGMHIQCVELLDNQMMAALNSSGMVNQTYPVLDTLFFKIQGDAVAVKQASNEIKAIVKKHGSKQFQYANTDEEAEDLWQGRKYALMSTLAAHEGSRCWTTDVCVPVSKLPHLVYDTKKDLAEHGIRNTILGHVGDGNFHALLLFEDGNKEEFRKVEDAVHRMVRRAIAMDGTCTGEHGVGIGKKEYLVEELGMSAVELMRTIKDALDPKGIMNPGKLYPDEIHGLWRKRKDGVWVERR